MMTRRWKCVTTAEEDKDGEETKVGRGRTPLMGRWLFVFADNYQRVNNVDVCVFF